MVNLLLVASAALLLPPGFSGDARTGADKGPRPSGGVTRMAQVRIQQHIVIRTARPDAVRRVSAPTAPLPPIAWVERSADKCVKMDRLSGAAVIRSDSVDLVLSGGKRLRAKLNDECPALDFYSGFYIKPTSDGMVCARRDSFRSRAGGECRIEGFRSLLPSR